MSLVLAAGSFAGAFACLEEACAILEGARLSRAADGPEALVLALRDDPDCALLDAGLPGMGVLDLIARLRSAAATSRMPLALLEGPGTDRGLALRALDAGADIALDATAGAARLAAGIGTLVRLRAAERGSGEGARRAEARAEERMGELRRERETLSRALSEKNTLVSEIHHRVKNDLQVVSSMLSIQATAADPQASRLLEAARGRVRTMAAVHEELYRSGEIDSLNLARSLPTLLALIREAFGVVDGRILFRSSVVPVSVPVRLAIPVSLVINEAISNSIQHAFPDERAGAVELLIRESEPGRLLCVVADDGVGMPEIGRADGLGISLIRALASQIDARLELTVTRGTRWELEFPAAS